MNQFVTGILLIFAGLLGSFLNAMVSSGSAVTLPLLIFLGIPPSVANATNRIPVAVGFFSSTLHFHRVGLIDWKKTVTLVIPICIGTIGGVLLVEQLSDNAIKYLLMAALLFSLTLALTKFKKVTFHQPSGIIAISRSTYLIFLIIGVWGGLIVLDTATFILLALTLNMGMDLIKANAMKSALCLIFVLVSLLFFDAGGMINWKAGLMVSVGSYVGGYIGSKLAIAEKSRIWLFRLLITVIFIEIISMIYKIITHKTM